MAAWTGWLLPAIVTLVLGFAASHYLRRVRLPGEETAAIIASLADMRWRDFIRLVLQVLSRRGYEPAPSASTGNEGDYLLERNGQRYLLSSRHGASFTMSEHAMDEFANDMRMQGAASGLLVTPGKFAPQVVQLAKAKQVQLLDGVSLWPEIRSLLPAEQRAHAVAPVHAQTRKHTLLAWAGALIVGIAMFFLAGSGGPTPPAAPTTERTPRDPGVHAPAAQTPPAITETTSPAPTDPALLQQRRAEVTKLASTLPQVDRAIWSTQSTLLVYLVDEGADPLTELCPILEHYEELRSSRVQLQPPQGSLRLVRFVQCKSF